MEIFSKNLNPIPHTDHNKQVQTRKATSPDSPRLHPPQPPPNQQTIFIFMVSRLRIVCATNTNSCLLRCLSIQTQKLSILSYMIWQVS